MGNPPPDLPSLANPQWLKDLIAAFPSRPDLHVQFVLQHQAQVEVERIARLAERSAATAGIRAQIAATALDHRGSTDWNRLVERTYAGPDGEEAYGFGDYKCNLFVYEMLTQGGARVEMELRTNRIGQQVGYPPLAGNWADPNFFIPGFEVLKVPPDSPQPGDVAAIKNDSENASGHAGIVVGPPGSPTNMTVSARSDSVKHNAWGFRDENKSQVVFRRYVGWPEYGGSSPETGFRTSGVAYETVPPVPEKPREQNKCSPARRGGK